MIKEVNNKVLLELIHKTYDCEGSIQLRKDHRSKEDFVIYRKVITGGIAGGSCWSESNDDLYRYDESYVSDFEILREVVKYLKPDITLAEFEEIESLYDEECDTDYEYYGNCTDYLIQSISLKTVCDTLGIKASYDNSFDIFK